MVRRITEAQFARMWEGGVKFERNAGETER
jgi:hypothetical protein